MNIPAGVIRQKEAELERFFAQYSRPGKGFRVRIDVLEERQGSYVSVRPESAAFAVSEADWAVVFSVDFTEDHMRLLKAIKQSGDTGLLGASIGKRPKVIIEGLRRMIYKKLPGFTVRSTNDPGHKINEHKRVYKLFRK